MGANNMGANIMGANNIGTNIIESNVTTHGQDRNKTCHQRIYCR